MSTITFIDCAYPKPHAIIEFAWSGRLDEEGRLWFDLHLKSDDYYSGEEETEETEEEDEEDDDDFSSDGHWRSKLVWNNYHCCTLSSVYWSGEQGILLDTSKSKFSFTDLDNHVFKLDNLPLKEDKDWEDLAFSIYLLGHDTCANHNIQFIATNDVTYTIKWTGDLALTYGGFTEFDKKFKAVIEAVLFDGFSYPKEWSQEYAYEHFKKVLADIDSFEFVDLNPKSFKREYKLMPKGRV